MNIITKKEWIYTKAAKYFTKKKKYYKLLVILVLAGGISTGITLNDNFLIETTTNISDKLEKNVIKNLLLSKLW